MSTYKYPVTVNANAFPFQLRNRFACISVSLIVNVNGMDVFPLTDIFVNVIVNEKNTDPRAIVQR